MGDYRPNYDYKVREAVPVIWEIIGSCEAAFDKRPIYRPNFDYRVREAVLSVRQD